MLKFAILGFLNYAPMTGYEIKQRIDRSTTHFWHAELSQIYVTLKELQKNEEVTSTLEEQSGRPDKRVYTITPKGRQDLHQWLEDSQVELSPKKELLILKIFFAAQLEPWQVRSQLQTALSLHRKQLEYYRHEAAESIRASGAEFPLLTQDVRMWEATRRFGEQYEELYVHWIEEMLAEFSEE